MCATAPGALTLPRAAFEDATRDTYMAVAAAATAIGQTPVRFWNFIPDLNAEIDPHIERYMVFNVGRFHAFDEWRRMVGGFDPSLATASGVGMPSPDLRVHCLTTASGGQRVENPRQVSPSRYSARYGPRPPCFARATRVLAHGRPLLLIGGTASIVGEQSLHPGDVRAQTRETIRNVAALLAGVLPQESAPLGRLHELRVYVRERGSADAVRDIVLEQCGALSRLEFVQAQICRQDLLVEIEGIADLS